ncbi:MAG: hypothetical protein ACJ77O_05140 [Chloroflexota bacterium]
MTDEQPNTNDEPTPDETFTWSSSDGPHGESAGRGSGSTSGSSSSTGGSPGATATAILGSIREAVDDLAERATPTVREFSARTAEFAAEAAEKASPYLRRAGDATAEASGKLATRSRSWAADVRASMGTAPDGSDAGGTGTEPGSAVADDDAPDGPTPA